MSGGGSWKMFDTEFDTFYVLQTTWGWLSSDCWLEHINMLLNLGFLCIMLFHFVRNSAAFLCKSTGRNKDRNLDMSLVWYKCSLSYYVSIISSIFLITSHSIKMVLLYQGDVLWCGSKTWVFASEIVEIILWSITLVVLHNKNHVWFPNILWFWWVYSFFISVVHALNILRETRTIEVPDYIEFFGSFACTCLLGSSLHGKMGNTAGMLEGITDPFLGTKHEEHSVEKKESLYAKATFLQLITFSWLDSLFDIGLKKPLENDQIPDIGIKESARFLTHSFDEYLRQIKVRDRTQNASIYKAIFMFVRGKAAKNACFAVISAGTSYVGPYLVNDFVNFLNTSEGKNLSYGYLLAVAFLAAKFIETTIQRQWIFGARVLGLRLRAALIAQIYQKGLVLSSQSRQSHTSGEIINYMSMDVQRIADFIWYVNIIWMLPIQITLAIYVLYTNLGLGSLAALAATLMIMACNVPITRAQKSFQRKIMEAKDDRMKFTTEVLRNMKMLKLHAWDSQFREKIEGLRNIEYRWLWKSQKLSAASTFIFWGSPTFISVVTFGACVLMGIPLTAGSVLSAFATFRMLQDPIFTLPDLLSVVAQGKVSADRITSYLQEEEIQTDAVQVVPHDQTAFSIHINQGQFCWDTKGSRRDLEEINLSVKRGMKVAICGKVGSGKSSLLSCVLGEMYKLSGTLTLSGTKAYVPQSPWILTGNIRENILFGNPFDSEKYYNTVHACALEKDLELFPCSDHTEIGERGINISGGQKQRIQIARAVYQDADIYLFDDPFSAVDAHTGTQLFKECLMGMLKEKTILYVTHQVEFLPAADLVVVMQDGKIAQAGKFEELLEQNTGFDELVGAHSQALQTILNASGKSPQTTCLVGDSKIDSIATEDELDNKQESEKNAPKKNSENRGKLLQDEEREKGSIGKEVYLSYLTTARGGALVPVILFAQTTFQVLQIFSNYWMAWACPPFDMVEPLAGMNYILLVYTLLAVGSSLCILVRAMLVALSGLLTSQELFKKMLYSVMRAPMAFFDSTPTGRILNRASTDQSVVDLEIANKLGWCAFSAIQIIGTIAVMSQVAWEVFVVIIPVTAICIWYQQYYIPTARELARLTGIQISPILHHFGESLSGAATIRAFDQRKRFVNGNLDLIDSYSRPWFHNVSAMEWLSFRLNQLSNFVFAFCLIFLVMIPEGIINPSMAGLAITYGINLNVLLATIIWNICNAENKMISVERILQYSKIASEASLVVEDCRPPRTWPENGTIQFINLEIRYADHLPPVLHNLNCTIPGRQKVGVVGRTGSGKSTLIQAIFRIVEAKEGSIVIDDLDISRIGLQDLRSKLSIIPQEPIMFEGTVRGNLDPLEQYSDDQLWQALDKCQLGNVIRAKQAKMDSTVVENGENWSVGQRQLICLGRALLKRSNILILDEATASVDSATDGIIQKIIHQEFGDRTIITIAHRIHTVIDSDLVLFLNEGRIAEYDAPAKLLEREDTLFSKLIKEYSIRSQIQHLSNTR